MVMIMVLAFAVAWTPYFLVSLITQYQTVNFMERGNFFFTMLNINLFAFLNSCVNPFIYAAMSTRFRNGFLRCFRCVCCAASTEGGPEIAGGQTDRTKRVRFRCQPACLIMQSSSDGGGSNVASDASLRTVYTVENSKRLSSLFGAFARKRQTPEQLSIAHYNKKGELVNLSRPLNIAKEDDNYTLENRLNALTEIQSLPKSQVEKGCSRSGDMFSLTLSTSSNTLCKKPPAGAFVPNGQLCARKWSSCLIMNRR